MTNGEKYKTAKERSEAFDGFCKSNTNNKVMCMPDCKLFHAQGDSKCYCGHCEFHWLDLEADEEKPLPCPFCGVEVNYHHGELMGTPTIRLVCRCGYSSKMSYTAEKAIAAHNRVAKAVRESEGK